jgi:hypothetical protein
MIPVGGALPVELEAVRTYWLDWYTADFMFSNWSMLDNRSPNASPAPKLAIANENDNIQISSRFSEYSRAVLLNGNDISSSWRVEISTKEGLNGIHLFTFRRDYTGEYKYIISAGDTTVSPITFSIEGIGPYIFTMVISDDKNGRLANVIFNPDQSMNPNPNRDTILVNFEKPLLYYNNPARRQ